MGLFWGFFAGTAIVLNVAGFIWQAWVITRKRSGEAVSIAWFASSVGLEIVNVIYGWDHSSWLFTVNALTSAAGQSLVLITLGNYKAVGKKEWAVFTATCIAIMAEILLPLKNIPQMAAQGINLYGGADQPAQLKKSKGTGTLAFLSLLLNGASGAIWTAYCWKYFGFLGPALGFLVYTLYSVFMMWQWLKKPYPSNNESQPSSD